MRIVVKERESGSDWDITVHPGGTAPEEPHNGLTAKAAQDLIAQTMAAFDATRSKSKPGDNTQPNNPTKPQPPKPNDPTNHKDPEKPKHNDRPGKHTGHGHKP
jgi:hypothetical protein